MHILLNFGLQLLPKLPTVALYAKSLPPIRTQHTNKHTNTHPHTKQTLRRDVGSKNPNQTTGFQHQDIRISSFAVMVVIFLCCPLRPKIQEKSTQHGQRKLTTTTMMAKEILDACHRAKKTEGRENLMKNSLQSI